MTITLADAVRMDLSLPDPDPEIAEPEIELPESDGKRVETPWHRDEIALLIDSAREVLRPRDDYFVGGDMCLYYDKQQAKNRAFLGPDFFYVDGADRTKHRRVWAVWQEDNRFPNVIVELQSSRTAYIDRYVKKDIYEQIFHTPEYFLYDPEARQLLGWILHNVHEGNGDERRYVPIAAGPDGRMWSNQLQLFLGLWEGVYGDTREVWLRFFRPDGSLVLTGAERAAIEFQKAEAERQRAEAERQRADAERQRAETERHRAEVAEAEIARLRAMLDASTRPSDAPTDSLPSS